MRRSPRKGSSFATHVQLFDFGRGEQQQALVADFERSLDRKGEAVEAEVKHFWQRCLLCDAAAPADTVFDGSQPCCPNSTVRFNTDDELAIYKYKRKLVGQIKQALRENSGASHIEIALKFRVRPEKVALFASHLDYTPRRGTDELADVPPASPVVSDDTRFSFNGAHLRVELPVIFKQTRLRLKASRFPIRRREATITTTGACTFAVQMLVAMDVYLAEALLQTRVRSGRTTSATEKWQCSLPMGFA